MKMVGFFVAAVIYSAALMYLLSGVLGFHLGVRIRGNLYAEEGFAFQKSTYLVLLLLLVSGGFYFVWRRTRK